jgi:tetratricopeptide (TPR) repeat protein
MPTIAEALEGGWKMHQAGRVEDAERIYRQVLAQFPAQPEALVYLGIAQFDRRQFEQSAESYRQALKIRDQFPIAWNNLGNTLRMLGEVDAAESCFETALAQDPKYLSAYKNRGTLWVWTGEIQRGMQWYEKGLEIDPGNAELHRNLGVINLLLGKYDVGWPEYRWRWRMPGTYRPSITAPVWQGEPLNGKTILLYPEQGRGDAIQFVRMTKLLQDCGARVVLQCMPEMIALFTSARGVDQLLPMQVAIPAVDYHASLIDAVDVWYTQHQELPFATEWIQDGYLNVSEPLIAYWQRWFESLPDLRNRKIGINWQGNPDHHADVYRSLPLTALKPLQEIPDVSLINLQFGFGVEQIESCGFGDQIRRLPEDVDTSGGAFTDTAAILQNLDCVVTSDTAIAHLAGALGVRVIMMLGKVPDWRWLTQGERTPWYPTMQIVRQQTMGDWDRVVAEVARLVSDTS